MIYLSLGENCLTDDILRRHKLKIFSTPYSPCRSNIDYALKLEEEKYNSIISMSNLIEFQEAGKRVVRSNHSCENIYTPLHMKGFEFTHHDLLYNESHRESFQRKINRLNEIRYKKDILFLYHHRRSDNTNLKRLREKIYKFSLFYKGCKNNVLMSIFYQTIVSEESDRDLEIVCNGSGIFEFNFKTMHLWGGDDPELFWGRVDEDLIEKMILYIKNITCSHSPSI